MLHHSRPRGPIDQPPPALPQAIGDLGRVVGSALQSLRVARELLESTPAAADAYRHVLDAHHAGELASRIAMTIRAGRADQQPATCLAESVERAIATVRPLVPEGTSVRSAHYPGLRIAMERTELTRVLFNVLANAVVSGVGVSRPNDVRVRTRTHVDWVAIIVTDSGRGIPPAVLEQLRDARKGFDPESGLGSTLAVLRRSGGSLRVQTQNGIGTEVTLEVPRAHTGDEW